MLGTIIEKELKSIILSPKFVATFAACSILILLSVWVGIQDYQASVEQYEAALKLNQQALSERNWAGFATSAYRPPDPMQIFVSGVNNDIGRLSSISRAADVKLRNSIYSDDPIFAVFRFVDLTFIVQIVLSLFAILFTYDAVNGEREGGTLALTFANPVPRAHFILGKFAGSWLGLVIPLAIPILLSMLLVMLSGVPMTPAHWQKVAMLMGAALLFFTFFLCFGVLVSSLTRRSAVSFLLSLVAWVVLVLIIPRMGVMAAGQSIQVPSMAEIESMQEGFAQSRWDEYKNEAQERWKERMSQTQGLSAEERTVANKQKMQQWMLEDSQFRAKVQEEIAAYQRRLTEERRNQLALQESLALTLARVSPAAAFQLTAMTLADTDIYLKARAEDTMRTYRDEVLELAEEKAGKQGDAMGHAMSFSFTTRTPPEKVSDEDGSSDGSGSSGSSDPSGSSSGDSGGGSAKPGAFRMSFSGGGAESPTLDPAEVPAYTPPDRTLEAALAPSILDLGLLALYSLAAFAAAFLAFLRYDVR
ncbi:MAG TPA: ABC transporter permease subunit [Acidobacteriota bacterium]|nr:ABC transporter permease subunit [Acidobacteriota bacterium]